MNEMLRQTVPIVFIMPTDAKHVRTGEIFLKRIMRETLILLRKE